MYHSERYPLLSYSGVANKMVWQVWIVLRRVWRPILSKFLLSRKQIATKSPPAEFYNHPGVCEKECLQGPTVGRPSNWPYTESTTQEATSKPKNCDTPSHTPHVLICVSPMHARKLILNGKICRPSWGSFICIVRPHPGGPMP